MYTITNVIRCVGCGEEPITENTESIEIAMFLAQGQIDRIRRVMPDGSTQALTETDVAAIRQITA